jgi:hypothetical protein
VLNATKPLAVHDRDAFLRAVAHALEQAGGDIGPGTVHRAIRETQRRYFLPPRVA